MPRVARSTAAPGSRLPRLAALTLLGLLVAACAGTALGPQQSPGGTPGETGPGSSPSITPALAATTAPASSPAPPGRPTPGVSSAPGASPGVRPSPAAGELAWTDCGGGFECATLDVPLDYDAPTGTAISLSLIRLPAIDPAERLGTLVTNPGGPGASGVDFVRQAATTVFSEALRTRFDILGFDPRGVGASAPVACVGPRELDRLIALDPTPDTAAERSALIDGTRSFVAACQANSAALLPHVGTRDAARDLDRIRAAVGDPALSYLGFSYGTFLGATYADLFPGRVRALVLDGAVDPTLPFEERNAQQAMSFAAAFGRFLDNCASRPACSFYSKGNPAAAYDALMARIDRAPLHAALTGDSRSVGPGEAFTAVAAALYDQSGWSILAQALAMAERGDGSVLLLLADSYNERRPDGTYANILAANNAVTCLDYASPADVAAYQALALRLEKLAPRFGEAVAWSGLTCALWPVHPAGDPVAPRASGASPILVIGSTGDPATPYAWAVKLAGELESGVLLTRRGEGHTAYGGKSACIDEAVDAYLITLLVPAAGTVCN
jgi:pimeloyl-ACP methyl ester carboxylesterase